MNLHLASKIIKNEVYALVVEGFVDIQGLIALHKDDCAKAVYVTWMCASPKKCLHLEMAISSRL